MAQGSQSAPTAADNSPVPLIDLVAQHQTISEDVLQAVSEVFATQSFVLGDAVADFEEEVARFCDARHTIGCASGTDALILSLMALNVEPGDEVITSPFTFFATASSIHRAGAKPVFVDIEPDGFNIDPDAVAAAVNHRTRAIMPVHLFGQTAEMDPIWRLAVDKGLAVVEDACQAIGAAYRGRQAGVLGTLGNFSFFPTKNLGGAGDGGMVTTDDAQLAQRIKRLRVHGDIGRYHHVEVGLNSRLDALQAAVLRVKLRHLAAWSEARRANAARYQELFAEHHLLDVLQPPQILADRTHVFNQYVVRVRDGQRDMLMNSLREQGIGCAVYYPQALHEQECFLSLGYKPGDFPESERACKEVLALPVFAELTVDQQVRVVRSIARAFGRLAGSVTPTETTPLPQRKVA